MTDQWIELNGEIYAVAMSKAKKRPRYNPAKMYQGNAKTTNWLCRLVAWWRQQRNEWVALCSK